MILHVDDEQMIRELTRELFTQMGHNVISAQSGEDACVLFKNGQCFDLLITDYSMPGMNGLELVTKVRGFSTDVPIIVLSVEAESIRTEALRLGATACVSKGNIQELVRQVRSVVR